MDELFVWSLASLTLNLLTDCVCGVCVCVLLSMPLIIFAFGFFFFSSVSSTSNNRAVVRTQRTSYVWLVLTLRTDRHH